MATKTNWQILYNKIGQNATHTYNIGPSRILDGLYLGSFADATNVSVYEEFKFDCVINFSDYDEEGLFV